MTLVFIPALLSKNWEKKQLSSIILNCAVTITYSKSYSCFKFDFKQQLNIRIHPQPTFQRRVDVDPTLKMKKIRGQIFNVAQR